MISVFKFQNGEVVRDSVTGTTGAVIARVDYISGCKSYLVQPRVGDDGNLPESVYIDEPTLERRLPPG